MYRENEKTFSYNIAAGKYERIELRPKDPLDIFIFDIQVIQSRAMLDDIQVMVMDELNYKSWEMRLAAIRAGANQNALPPFETYVNTKHCWGTLVFQPQNEKSHYLVLNNSHSSFQAKQVNVSARRSSYEMPYRRIVRETAKIRSLPEFWKLFEESESCSSSATYSTACGSARTALAILWKAVCQTLSGKHINFDPGKSVDIGILKNILESYAPAHMVNLICQAWSVNSELYHVEKRDGKEPKPQEAQFALNFAYWAMAYLCSLLPKE